MRTPEKAPEQRPPGVRGLELGVDQKSHDQWVMSVSMVGSYDERGEAGDTASYHGARRSPGIAGFEGGRCVLVDRATPRWVLDRV